MILDDLTFIAERAARHISATAKVGKVTSTSPFEVTLYGDSSGKPISLRLSSYTPVLNDKVVLITAENQLICLGKIV